MDTREELKKQYPNLKSPSSVDEAALANDEDLRFCLLTCDGKGEKIKAAALDELLKRAEKKGFDEGWDDGYRNN